jgi:ubiquinone/menaquinone biosynthesis C-methylase UbiE
MTQDQQIIDEAFSRVAEKYDQFAVDHPHLTRMREIVYRQVESEVPKPAHILELNSGTGTDAAALVKRGYRVHATDISQGMLARAQEKSSNLPDQDGLTIQRVSFTEIDQITGGPYDAVFSNLGGLNCVADLQPVINALPNVLRSGGKVIWVLMPPFCIWEFATILQGQFKLAFRRLSRNGTIAHLEGLYFPVYYFSPRAVTRQLDSRYKVLDIRGLAVITPTAESKNFARRFPRLYKTLAWLDDSLSPHWPWYGLGDFFILSFQYLGDQ